MQTILVNSVKKWTQVFPTRSLFTFFKKKDSGEWSFVNVGNVSKTQLEVPDHIEKPEYYFRLMEPGDTTGNPEIKTDDQIQRMKESCKLAANVLKSCEQAVQVGISTEEINKFVHNKIIAAGAYPSPLNYAGFPKSVCTSVNNVACHGIPDDRKLENGDIINVDITVFLNGYHGDCSRTFLVGNVDEQGRYLVACTEQCLQGAIEQCAPNRPFNFIGWFVDKFAQSKKLASMPAFIGHGIGSYFHGPPEILHFSNNMPGTMQPGMTFTIEPILTLGGIEVEIQEDGWTAMSTDGARSAQFEHTVLITKDGVEILTNPD